jgi:hypothetical protein
MASVGGDMAKNDWDNFGLGLSAFQMKTFEKPDVFSIFEMLNHNRENPLDLADLKRCVRRSLARLPA